MNCRPKFREVRAEITCALDRLTDLADGERLQALDKLLGVLGLSLISSHHHIFPNFGLTYVAILKESHLAIHTWPEHEFILFDLFLCSDLGDYTIQNYLDGFTTWLNGTLVSATIVER